LHRKKGYTGGLTVGGHKVVRGAVCLGGSDVGGVCAGAGELLVGTAAEYHRKK